SPAIQGPIDDALTKSFVCIRGTGTPWNANVQKWADASLWRFSYEGNRYFRGDLPGRCYIATSAADLHRKNVIWFGDSGSNEVFRRMLPKLPIKWTPRFLEFSGKRYTSKDHVPVFILPNPDDPTSYVVLNSGHTFHEAELNRLNYLLFPRLGDWAVVKVGDKQPANPSEPLNEQVLEAGYFDEQWKFPRARERSH